jgi:hypothetical protein
VLFLKKCIPTEQQLDGPSKANFIIDLLGLPRSGWNRKVAQIFTEDIVTVGWHNYKNKADIQRRFTKHMGYMIKKYKEQQKEAASDGAAAFRLSQAARRRRKLTVSISCIVTMTKNID